ncbi:MAG: hypothetical protein NT051_05445 [Candidatus Micrarchaeota archaeon]|nr:hypothetical protein [Candidatus Micrarchaeota archaeon]
MKNSSKVMLGVMIGTSVACSDKLPTRKMYALPLQTGRTIGIDEALQRIKSELKNLSVFDSAYLYRKEDAKKAEVAKADSLCEFLSGCTIRSKEDALRIIELLETRVVYQEIAPTQTKVGDRGEISKKEAQDIFNGKTPVSKVTHVCGQEIIKVIYNKIRNAGFQDKEIDGRLDAIVGKPQ